LESLLYQRLTCDEHFGLFGKAYGFESVQMEKSRDSIYDVLGLVGYRDVRVDELSGGNRPSSISAVRHRSILRRKWPDRMPSS
jgi:ABC-type Na+ transport system ATPase subunit NatA